MPTLTEKLNKWEFGFTTSKKGVELDLESDDDSLFAEDGTVTDPELSVISSLEMNPRTAQRGHDRTK